MRRDVPAQGATVVSGCTRDWTVFPVQARDWTVFPVQARDWTVFAVQARDWPEHRVGTGLGIA
jgi:hypothetical protein